MAHYNFKWWHYAVIYEIFPKSFYDSNNDGIGDIKGIIAKLDYLKRLGVDAIWLCPIFKSPFKDSGYDIEDYYSVNPYFGNMTDVELLIKKAHDKKIKIILDIVLNHTSDKHPWFRSACASKKSPYRDYYIFRESKNKEFPNNWKSSKTLQSVWTHNKQTDDYYLHIYTKYQPDLNWANRSLRMALYNVLKFWLNKGINGFRLDVINKIAKKEGLPDLPKNAQHYYADHFFENQEKVHKYIYEMHQEVFNDFPDALIMGQTSGVSPEQAYEYAHPGREELNLYLQFDHVDIDRGLEGKRKHWTVEHFKKRIMKWQALTYNEVWSTLFFGSHDLPRMVEHFGDTSKEYHILSAKMLIALQLCLKGTPIIYMGDELALKNINYTNIDAFEDVRSHDIYQVRLNRGEYKDSILKDLNFLARDNARYPIPWDRADKLEKDDQSILAFYRQIIAFRKSEPTILYGNIKPILDNIDGLFAYEREYQGTIITLFSNMTKKLIQLNTNAYGEVIIANYNDRSKSYLSPYEVRICRLKNNAKHNKAVFIGI